MGIYMMTVWYPPHKASEIAKLYFKQPRGVPFITKWRVFNTSGGLDGVKQYHLFYTERGKAEEAIPILQHEHTLREAEVPAGGELLPERQFRVHSGQLDWGWWLV